MSFNLNLKIGHSLISECLKVVLNNNNNNKKKEINHIKSLNKANT